MGGGGGGEVSIHTSDTESKGGRGDGSKGGGSEKCGVTSPQTAKLQDRGGIVLAPVIPSVSARDLCPCPLPTNSGCTFTPTTARGMQRC